MKLNPSLFEELSFNVGYSNTYPTSLAHRIHRLVLARNVAAISSLLQETIQLTGDASIGVTKIADFDFDTFEQRAWVDEWRGDFFRQLWVLREDLEFQGYRLQQNLRVVNGLKVVVPGKGSALSDRTDTRSTIWDEPTLRDESSVNDESDRLAEVLKEEQIRGDLSEWEDLEKLRLYAFRIMERTTDSYLQTVQATGAQFANMQSKRFHFHLDQPLYHKLICVIVLHD